MRKIWTCFLAMTSIVVMNTGASFAGGDKTGEAGFMFLRVPMGAREASMGNAGVAQSVGAASLYWNPANISSVEGYSVYFTNLNYFAGINANYLAASLPIADVGTFAASVNYLSYGQIDITTVDQPTGTGASYSPYDMALTAAFSKQITDRVSGGMSVKFVHSQIDHVSASGLAFDFGFAYRTGIRGLQFGFVASNFGAKSQYQGDGLIREIDSDPDDPNEKGFLRFSAEPFEMPASVSLGMSMDLMRNGQNAVVAAVDHRVNNFEANKTSFGLEYGYNQMFFLRAGYSSPFQKNADYTGISGNKSGLTAGVGFSYGLAESMRAQLDYAYADMGLLNSVHRIAIGLTF